jgi:Raf kinase inhibitor-like YbhB/YbcL family protein
MLPQARITTRMALTVTSTFFTEGGRIPETVVFNGFGYSGGNQSPDLRWSGAPAETKSFAITCYDPDAPTTVGFWHWLLFDLPPSTTSLPAGAGTPGKNPAGSTMGYTDFGLSAFGGPAPPPGPAHRYHFNVYALDIEKLGLEAGATGALVMFVIGQHTLEKGTLTGIYGKA